MSMCKGIPLRLWATPLTIGSFLLVAATGVLMFFGWNRGLTSVAHEWFSWLFLAGSAVHIAVNFRLFLNQLKSRWGKTSVAVFAVILVASCFSWGIMTGHQLVHPIERALLDAPLSALAGVVRTTPEALALRLKEHGIDAASQQSVRDLSAESGVNEHQLLSIMFSPQ